MPKSRTVGSFVGVPDDMLRSIGIVIVLAAQTDLRRMQLHEAATRVPVTTSAGWPRGKLTNALDEAFSQPPFDRMQVTVSHWFNDISQLFDIRDDLAHSVGGFESRGDGRQRFVLYEPKTGKTRRQFTAAKLAEIVERMHDAHFVGARLYFEAISLANGGVEGHEAYLASQREYRARVEALQDLATEESSTQE